MATQVAPRERQAAVRPQQAAWIALLPCALVTFAAMMAIGPVIGHAIFEPSAGEALWPPGTFATQGHPEPVKRGRFVVALLGVALLVAAVRSSKGRPLRLRPATVRGLVAVSQLSVLALAAVAVLGQSNLLLRYAQPLWPIFGVPTYVVAALLAAAVLAATRSQAIVQRAVRLTRETRTVRTACLLAAAGLAAVWLLPAVATDRGIGDTPYLWWTTDDPFAILNGRTPLVDYHAFYAQLTPYLAAGALAAFGHTALTYTITMVSLSLLTLLAVYAVLRRVVGGRSLIALALFAPVVATGYLVIQPGPHAVPEAQGNQVLFAIWPMRYGGAYLVAWLTSRHLDRAAPRKAWLLFLAAGLVMLDNLEFGGPAFAGALAAVVCARPRWSPEAVRRLVRDAAGGLLCAGGVVSLVALAHGGGLPHPGMLLEWPRVFGVLGLEAMPMPALGFHLILLATYVAAVAVAVVRRVTGAPHTLLTAMLAWSGVFGLLSGSYYLGRSDGYKLLALFSAWAFALALLTIVVVRRLAERGGARPQLAELLVMLGFGLAICSLHELPLPWTQLERLSQDQPAGAYQPTATRFVARHTRAGERVTILIPLGHRIAEELHIANVSPYPFIETVVTRHQLELVIDQTHREGAHKIFIAVALTARQQLAVLAAAGYSQRAYEANFSEWSDA